MACPTIGAVRLVDDAGAAYFAGLARQGVDYFVPAEHRVRAVVAAMATTGPVPVVADIIGGGHDLHVLFPHQYDGRPTAPVVALPPRLVALFVPGPPVPAPLEDPGRHPADAWWKVKGWGVVRILTAWTDWFMAFTPLAEASHGSQPQVPPAR